MVKPANRAETPLLSVVMPVYNERASVLSVIDHVLRAPVESLELIVVDDGSTDGTRDVLQDGLHGPQHDRVRVILHERNRGKGAALRSGFGEARGRFVLIQDADFEYDPQEYPQLLQPLLEDKADVVFGSRFMAGPRRVLYFWHAVGNRFLTLLSNMVTDLNLTDMETCYKVFRRDVVQSLDLREDRFGIEPEMTAKVAERGVRIWEVPISYSGRTYAEGKKIGAKDGFRAIYCILRYGLPGRVNRTPKPQQAPPRNVQPLRQVGGRTPEGRKKRFS